MTLNDTLRILSRKMEGKFYKSYCCKSTQTEISLRACNTLHVSISCISDPHQEGLTVLDTVRISACLDFENTMGFVTVDPRNALWDVTFHIQRLRDTHVVTQQAPSFCHTQLLKISIIRDVPLSQCVNLASLIL
jgi:hypothetical protein